MRLPFGIKSAPGYFQEIMEQLTRDLRGVAVYMDNILVSGNNAQKHTKNLKALFRCLNEKGLCYNLDKCIFAQPSVVYQGHTQLVKRWSCQGIQGKCCTQDATANKCGNTEIFYGLGAVLRKVLATISVSDNRAIA